MLSSGEYYKSVPKDLVANMEWRRRLLERAAGDRSFQKGIIEACRQDILFYINAFCYQFDPTQKGGKRVGPFVTWPFQDRALLDTPETTGRKGVLWCYENDRSMVIEKSREMGATWLFLLAEDWLCGFHRYVQALNISRSANAVESKTKNSLFTKLRFIHEHLPTWLIGEITEEKMFFGFKRTKSEITGEASTSRAGVGGRGSVIFVDEYSEIEEDVQVREKLASTGNCRFFNSTHLGTGTQFYELTQNTDYVQLQMHWTRHPAKNKGLYSWDLEEKRLRFWEYVEETDEIVEIKSTEQGCSVEYDYGDDYPFDRTGRPVGGPHPGIRSPWYDWKSKEIGSDRGVAMQLDINAKGSVSQFFDALLIRDLRKRCTDPLWEGDVVCDEYGGNVRLLHREGGPLRLWCNLIDGRPPEANYGAGSDVSQGTGCTPSCLSFTNGITGEKVGEFVDSRIPPKEFGTLAVGLCRFFHNARLVWEHHGPGVSFANQVIDLGYMHVYTKVGVDKLGRPRSDSIGWNPVGMGTLLNEYQSSLKKREMLNPSDRALAECLMFKYDSRGKVIHSQVVNDDLSAARENHGDLTVSDALSWLIVRDDGRLTAVAKKRERKIEQWHDPRTHAGRFAIWEAEQALEESWD